MWIIFPGGNQVLLRLPPDSTGRLPSGHAWLVRLGLKCPASLSTHLESPLQMEPPTEAERNLPLCDAANWLTICNLFCLLYENISHILLSEKPETISTHFAQKYPFLYMPHILWTYEILWDIQKGKKKKKLLIGVVDGGSRLCGGSYSPRPSLESRSAENTFRFGTCTPPLVYKCTWGRDGFQIRLSMSNQFIMRILLCL